MTAQVVKPDFRELFTPKLFTVLRERYGLEAFRADVNGYPGQGARAEIRPCDIPYA